jgi:hypothetical protein
MSPCRILAVGSGVMFGGEEKKCRSGRVKQ